MAADPGHASGREVSRFREFAREVIEHHFGSRPKRITHESGGLSNFVFSATHPDGKFIIRISPHASALNSYIKEQWTQKAAAKATNGPAPRAKSRK